MQRGRMRLQRRAQTHNRSNPRMNRIQKLSGGRLLLLVLLMLAAFLIYLPPESGIALTIQPDSSEYSICLSNLFEHGRFGFTLNGEWYPSRYTPWFSLFCLSPAYFFCGGNVLCLHYAILFFALVLLTAVWKIGAKTGLGRMSVLPMILIIFTPDFLFYSRVVMTEIPYAALFSVSALAFVRFANSEDYSLWHCLLIGGLIAWTGMVRFSGFALLMPFALLLLLKDIGWQRKLSLIATLSAPIAVAQSLGAVYNWLVFGSPFRSGYHYWLPIPSDFSELTFNLSYVLPCVCYYLRQPIIQISMVFLLVGLVACVLALRTGRNRNFVLLYVYVSIHSMVLLALYTAYYFRDTRFFLAISLCSVLLLFIAVSEMLAGISKPWRSALVVLVFSGSLVALLQTKSRYLPYAIERTSLLALAQLSSAILPPESVVLQRGDPNIMDYYGFRDKQLILYPLNREFDYVSNMTATQSIAPYCKRPEKCYPGIKPELVASGICKLPFPGTFKETPEEVSAYIAKGKRVFVAGVFRDKEELDGVTSRMEGMGLKLIRFGTWRLPGIEPNQVRHVYDKLLFGDRSMDSRQEITVTYYEIVKRGHGREGDSIQGT